jgi:hypothetical protein
VEAFVGPLERLGLGGGLEAVVEVSDLLEVVGGAGEELGGDGVARFNEGENGILVVVGRRYANSVLDGAAADRDFAEVDRRAGRDLPIVDIDGVEQGVAAAVFDEANRVVALPVDPGRCAVNVRGHIGGISA